MILVRAPLRISFIGGGTDLPAYFRHSPGRVVSSTIDKYVYIAINPTPLIEKVSIRYSQSETVDHPQFLQHSRIKAALLDLGIEKQIEIGSFASLPARTGLGSSSSFSVALMKGLWAHLGKKLSKEEAAEAACRLEIDLVGEPIGKQDQYAAAFGGFNMFQFNLGGSVVAEPILLDYKTRAALESYLLLFFTGITRDAGAILQKQQGEVAAHMDAYRGLAEAALDFRSALLAGDFPRLGAILHEGWLVKRRLAAAISNSAIDALYERGIAAGAYGGKLLGAGAGGCILFLVLPEKRAGVWEALRTTAEAVGLMGAREIPFRFTHTGTDVLFNAHGGVYF